MKLRWPKKPTAMETADYALNVMQSQRENLGFSAYWEAYKIVLAARAQRGDSPQGAAEYAHEAAAIAEVDYRDRSRLRDKRVAEMWEKNR